MEDIYNYLDKVKAEMEKLQAEYHAKTELYESLKECHNAQLLKLEEARLEIEKQARVLAVQSEEVSQARKSIENLKSSLHEKELSLRHLSSANDQLRADCGKKLHKLEEENKEVVLALDESLSTNKELKQTICASNEEIAHLKRLLAESEKKYFEREKKLNTSKELEKREDMILKLEEDNKNIREQLRWKQEQFNHLEEALKSLQDRFRLHKEEYQREKSGLLEDISSLQTGLDSQIVSSEDLQGQLEISKQALVHEESSRKLLEFQVSEMESCFKNILIQSLEEKSSLENLTCERIEQIAMLTNLETKLEAVATEMENNISYPHQKNGELGKSLKGFQETEIWKAGVPLLKMLLKKIRDLESEFSEAYSNLESAKAELELLNKDKADKVTFLTAELEISNRALSRTSLYLEGYQLEVSSFLDKVKSPDFMELPPILYEEGPERLRQGQTLHELLDNQLQLNEQVQKMKKILKDDRTDALESFKESHFTLADNMFARLDSKELSEAEKFNLLGVSITNEEVQCITDLPAEVTPMEIENQNLHQKLDFQEALSYLKQVALPLHASSKAKELETEKFLNQYGIQQKNMESLVEKLEAEKGGLLQVNMGIHSEKKDVLNEVEEICGRMREFSCEDVKLTKILEKILQYEKERRPEMSSKAIDEHCDSAQGNADSLPLSLS